MAFSLEQVTAVVLAGGFGTRIRHVLPDLPKPMAPVAGRPFVEWVVRFLGKQGVRRVVLSTGYLAEKIEARFAGGRVGPVEVSCVAERSPLGTAGGFLNAVEASGSETRGWLVLNGDSLVLTALEPLVMALNAEAEVALLGLRVADASRYGSLEVDETGQLLAFAEKRPGPAVINAGVYLMRPEVLERFPAGRPLSFETDLFPGLVAAGARIQVVPVDAPFLDIGTEASLKEAEGFIMRNQQRFEMAAGA